MSRRTIKSATGAWRGKPIACYSTLSITLLRYLFSFSLVSTLQYPVLHVLSSPNIVTLLSLVFHIFANSFKSFALELTSDAIAWTKFTPYVNSKARQSFRKTGITSNGNVFSCVMWHLFYAMLFRILVPLLCMKRCII